MSTHTFIAQGLHSIVTTPDTGISIGAFLASNAYHWQELTKQTRPQIFGKPAAKRAFNSNLSSRGSLSSFFAYLRNTTDLRIYHPGDGCSGPVLVHNQSLLISSGLFRASPPIVAASVSVNKTISCVWLPCTGAPKIVKSALSMKAKGGQTHFVLVNSCHCMAITGRSMGCASTVMPLKGEIQQFSHSQVLIIVIIPHACIRLILWHRLRTYRAVKVALIDCVSSNVSSLALLPRRWQCWLSGWLASSRDISSTSDPWILAVPADVQWPTGHRFHFNWELFLIKKKKDWINNGLLKTPREHLLSSLLH